MAREKAMLRDTLYPRPHSLTPQAVHETCTIDKRYPPRATTKHPPPSCALKSEIRVCLHAKTRASEIIKSSAAPRKYFSSPQSFLINQKMEKQVVQRASRLRGWLRENLKRAALISSRSLRILALLCKAILYRPPRELYYRQERCHKVKHFTNS